MTKQINRAIMCSDVQCNIGVDPSKITFRVGFCCILRFKIIIIDYFYKRCKNVQQVAQKSLSSDRSALLTRKLRIDHIILLFANEGAIRCAKKLKQNKIIKIVSYLSKIGRAIIRSVYHN